MIFIKHVYLNIYISGDIACMFGKKKLQISETGNNLDFSNKFCVDCPSWASKCTLFAGLCKKIEMILFTQIFRECDPLSKIKFVYKKKVKDGK